MQKSISLFNWPISPHIYVHYYDSSAILAEPLKNQTSGEIECALLLIVEKLHYYGNTPKTHMMGNKAFHDLKQSCAKHRLNY